MGAEVSDLGQYSFEESANDDGLWVVKQGVSDDDDTLITVFSDESGDSQKRQMFHRNIKFLRSLRHPCLLHYLSSGETSTGSYVVTERVAPLRQVLDTLHPSEVCAGLFDILQGLSFLHGRAGICHNNVCIDAIYVACNGKWKVGGLEHACKYEEVTPDMLSRTRKYRNERSISPEEKENKMNTSSDLGHTRDVYAFAVISEILLEHLHDLGDQTKTFELIIQDECLHPDPKSRPKLNKLLNDRLFRNDFLSMSRFLQDITLKTEIERKVFFSDTLQKLLDLPEEVVARRLAQPLLCRFVLLDMTARESLLPHLLTPCTEGKRSRYVIRGEINPVFTADIFKLYIVPELYKIFHCHNYYIRMVLLTYFSRYVDLFDKTSLEEEIFPQVLLGVRDAHDDLAALSLRALADLVPVLGRDVVIGGKSKVYFSTGSPKFDGKVQRSVHEGFTGNGGISNILLKDLAKISHGYKHDSVETDDDKERKKKEREERKQEAKRKREQRRQEKLRHSLGSEIPTAVKETSHHSGTSLSTDKLSDTDTNVVQSIDDSYIQSRVDSSNAQFISKDCGLSLEESVINLSNQNEDWLDWDDADETNDSIGQRKSDTSVHSSSCDVIGQTLSHDLYSDLNNTNTEQFATNSFINDVEKSIKNKKTSSEVSYKTENKPVEKKKAGMSLKGAKRVVPKKKQVLGSEFDIKSIEIETKSAPAEFDFFAEMAPEIKPVNLLSEIDSMIVENKEKENEQQKSEQNVKSELSYQAADTDTGDGWGDDLEWGEDGF